MTHNGDAHYACADVIREKGAEAACCGCTGHHCMVPQAGSTRFTLLRTGGAALRERAAQYLEAVGRYAQECEQAQHSDPATLWSLLEEGQDLIKKLTQV